MSHVEITQSIQKKSICPLDCPDSCGLVVTVADNKVVSLGGDPEHPYTNGFICKKMRHYPERLYGEERILYPQMRVGEKGEGSFRRVSWKEALEVCAKRLLDIKNRYGGESILPYSYAGNMGAINRFAGYPLFHKLGALQLDQTICSAAAGAGWKANCGDLPGCPPENAADSDLIVAWGINIRVTNVHFWQYVRTARKKGAKLIVIDPYKNQTAKSGDLYIQVKPGGDVGLALGICKILVESGEFDRNFVGTWTLGFDQLVDYLRSTELKDFAFDSGVSEEQLNELAIMMRNSAKTFFRIGIGLTRHSRGGMSVRAITSLAAALGLFSGGVGRGVLLSTGSFHGDKECVTWKSLLEKETQTINMIHLGHALSESGPGVKALIVYNSNPLSVSPDATSVRRGLMREDLFTVVHEQVMTPTAKYADLLLPATTFLENHDVYTAYGHFYLGVAKPAIEPVGEAKSNFDLFQELAKELGYDDPPFRQSFSERIRGYLETMRGIPGGTDIATILNGGYFQSDRSVKEGRALTTTCAKFRFVNTNDPALPEIACLTSPAEFADKDLQSRFPLSLITPPHPELLNSTFGEKFKGYQGELLVHPVDADKYNIVDGRQVEIENSRGSVVRIARVSEDTAPGVVVAEGIFWPVASPTGSKGYTGINDLTSQKETDLGGGATFHESLVAIGPVSFS